MSHTFFSDFECESLASVPTHTKPYTYIPVVCVPESQVRKRVLDKKVFGGGVPEVHISGSI